MLNYILRRLALMVPTLLGVMALVFLVMAYSPGGFGIQKDAQGSQNQGYDAKRIQRLMSRRYGADLPKAVQFSRWLNQVSPVGFKMSTQIGFSTEQKAEAKAALATEPFAQRSRDLDRAVDMVLTAAGYLGQSPAEVAELLRQDTAALNSVEGLDQAMAWFDRMDAGLDEQDLLQIRGRVQEKLTQGFARGQREFFVALGSETAGRSRIRWDKPAFKAPDFGESIQGRQVSDLLAQRLPVTLLLNLITVPLIYLVAIVSGLYTARYKGSWFDIGTGGLFIALWSVPVIWMGTMFLELFANEQLADRLYGGWHFPTGGLHDLQADTMPFFPRLGSDGFVAGYLLDTAWHLVLPVVCLTYTGFAVLSKVMRGSILESLSADYVRTARAKGVTERDVLWRHAFRNSILPLITMAASIIPALFVGSVVVESLFSIEGMGKLVVEAAFAKDKEVVLATTLIAAILKLSSELLRDICYAIADPRVTYE